MHRAKALFDLQGIDIQIDAATERLALVESQLGENPAILAAHQALEERRHHHGQLERQLRALENQADDLAAKVSAEEVKLYGGTVRNPKELASLQEEVDQIKGRRREVEDQALDIMSQTEAEELVIAQEATALAAEEEAWAESQRQLREEQSQLQDQLQAWQQERQAQAAQIALADLGAYQMIREARGGRGTVRVEQGRCGGCRISLSIADLQRTRGHDLVRCSSCGRILYAG